MKLEWVVDLWANYPFNFTSNICGDTVNHLSIKP
jgi:hypothetical protein